MTAATERSSDPRVSPSLVAALRRYLPPVVVSVFVLVVWQLYYTGEGMFRPIPTPTEIGTAMLEEWDALSRATGNTIIEALGGLAIGTTAGLAIGFLTARWAIARDILLPLAIGASTIPIIAIAPILNNWFGVLNPMSKMMMAALLVFFPVVINVTRGLVEVGDDQLELMRSYAASEQTVLRKVRLPNMLPFFFTALKVGSTLAFIGAIVGEFFGGNSTVLGYYVVTSISGARFDEAWAAIIIGAAAAMLSYLAVTLVERRVIPWYWAQYEDAA